MGYKKTLFAVDISSRNKRNAIRWCTDQFGSRPIRTFPATRYNNYNTRGYDRTKARWMQCRDTRYKKFKNRFKFRYEDDAILFKLTWT